MGNIYQNVHYNLIINLRTLKSAYNLLKFFLHKYLINGHLILEIEYEN